MSTVVIERAHSPIKSIKAKSTFSGMPLTIRPLDGPMDRAPYEALAYSPDGRGVHLTATQLREIAAGLVEMAEQLEARA